MHVLNPSKSRQTPRRPQAFLSAFSLLELLVVISILAVLLALLLPVFSTARKQAQEQTCASNLRQIGIALHTYTIDYDDLYPYSLSGKAKQSGDGIFGHEELTPAQIAKIPTAKDALSPYLNNERVFACPLDFGGELGTNRTVASYYDAIGDSYGFATLLKGESFGCVAEPSQYIYAIDYTGEWHSAPNTYILSRKKCRLFFDGHVVCSVPDPQAPSYFFSPCEKPFKAKGEK